jgi:hypothetical protein
MWRAHPVGWLARSDLVEESGRTIGTLECGSWSECGALVLDGQRLSIRREGYWNPTFHLLEKQATLATVRPAGAFRCGYCLVWGDEEFRVDRSSTFGRSFAVTRRGQFLGQIRAIGWFSRRVQIEIAEELPRELRLFALWLVLLAWRRAAVATAAT